MILIQNIINGQWIRKVHFDSILKSKDIKWLNHDRKRITEIDYNDESWKNYQFEEIKRDFQRNYFNGSVWLRNNFQIKDYTNGIFNLKLGK